MRRLALDLRYTLRGLHRHRGTAALAVLSLGMGIGFTTMLFSIVHGATRSLPFHDPAELVVVAWTDPAHGRTDVLPRPADLEEWRRQQTSFESLAAYYTSSMNLSGPGARPERFTGTGITPNAFGVLGAAPALGRALLPSDAEPDALPVVLLGHDAWRARFGGDSAVIGATIRVNGTPRTVVGVMPPAFRFPVNSDLWLPHAFASAGPDSGYRLRVFGRLRDGASVGRARAEMDAIARRMARAYPATHAGRGARVFPFTDLELDGEVRRALYVMLFAASLVLLIACANVTNLLLAWAAARTREVALRLALGASPRRLVAQHLAESLMLAAAGGALGLAIAWAGVGYFRAATAAIIEAFWMDFRVDATVFACAVALVLAAALAAGLVPALRSARGEPAELLKDGAAAATVRIGRLGRGLIVGEIALACGLLVVATLLVQAAAAVRGTAFPFDTRRILTAQLALGEWTPADSAERDAVLRAVPERVASVPGVRAAALMSALPGRGAGQWPFALDGAAADRPQDLPSTAVTFVTPGFLDVLESRATRGRPLAWTDDARAPHVALVNEPWVARYSRGRDPVGRQIRLAGRPAMTVVGVVPDLAMNDAEDRRADGIYVPILQHPYSIARVVARTTGSPLAAVPAVRDAVESVDPDLPLFEVASLRDAIYADRKVLDAFAALFFTFGVGALVLTATGLYGVLAFAVSRRTREFGIRMALGARRRDVVTLVVRQGGRQVGAGLALGLALAALLAHVLASAIEMLDPLDPVVYSAVIGLLGVTAAAALLAPARRAAGITPLEALRGD